MRTARLTPRFPLSAAEPTALPAPVSSTAADATTPVVAPAASTHNPFIARPGPTAAAASPDAANSTNPADNKPQYVFTWFLNNYLGTTIASSNAAEEIAEIETDAFGAPLARGTLPADMRYTGKPYDEDMGAYIFLFHNYRTDEDRWMTPDPNGFPDGPNNRVYAANPMHQIDPYGLWVWDNSRLMDGGNYSASNSGHLYSLSTTEITAYDLLARYDNTNNSVTLYRAGFSWGWSMVGE